MPGRTERAELRLCVNEVLCWVEELYEKSGMDFSGDAGRRAFWRSFGLLEMTRRLHVPLERARVVRKRAYWRWARWMESEKERLKTLGDGKAGYLEVRRGLRLGESGWGNSSVEVLEAARESLGSARWR